MHTTNECMPVQCLVSLTCLFHDFNHNHVCVFKNKPTSPYVGWVYWLFVCFVFLSFFSVVFVSLAPRFNPVLPLALIHDHTSSHTKFLAVSEGSSPCSSLFSSDSCCSGSLSADSTQPLPSEQLKVHKAHRALEKRPWRWPPQEAERFKWKHSYLPPCVCLCLLLVWSFFSRYDCSSLDLSFLLLLLLIL